MECLSILVRGECVRIHAGLERHSGDSKSIHVMHAMLGVGCQSVVVLGPAELTTSWVEPIGRELGFRQIKL